MTARTKRRFKPLKLLLLLFLVAVAINSISILKFFYPLHHWDHIVASATAANIDPFFIAAIIKTESSFNPNAISPKGARGLMQIMPDTGHWIARHMQMNSFDQDVLFDPKTNISMGTWYIANLQQEFGNNTVAVLAAYNGGRGNVQKWLSEQIISGSSADIDAIPFPETKHFVRKVTRDYYIYSWLYQNKKNVDNN